MDSSKQLLTYVPGPPGRFATSSCALNLLRPRQRIVLSAGIGTLGIGKSSINRHLMVAGQARKVDGTVPADLDEAAAASFPVGHGVASQTMGVTIPSYVIPTKGRSAAAGALHMVLDVEGWGAAKNVGEDYDVSLVIFLCMVCNCIMVNTTYRRTDQANQANIFLALSQARALLLQGEDGKSFKPPSIQILVRDWPEGAKFTAADFQADLLKQLEAAPAIDDMVCAVVRDAVVIPVPSPTAEENILDLDRMSFSTLKESYKNAVHRVLNSIAETAVPKSCDGHHLTGPELCEIVSGTVERLNEGMTSKVAGCYVALLMRKLQQHAEIAKETYHREMLPAHKFIMEGDKAILEHAHSKAVAAALAEFKRLCESISRGDLVAVQMKQLEECFSSAKNLITAEFNALQVNKQAKKLEQALADNKKTGDEIEKLRQLYNTVVQDKQRTDEEVRRLQEDLRRSQESQGSRFWDMFKLALVMIATAGGGVGRS